MNVYLKNLSTPYGRISYRSNDNKSEISLVFVHGAAGDSRLFHGQLRHFCRKYKVIAIDLPGHGKSQASDKPEIDDYVGAIFEVMQAENITSFVLIGHSMGGCICTR